MAVKTSEQWSAQMRAALAQIDPQMSTEVGDPIRKIIDAASSVAASVDLNSRVNMSFLDLNSKSGPDLDALASWLGFGRRDGLCAVGEVRFFLDAPAPVAVEIPAGTQVTDGSMTFATSSSCVIGQWETEAFCPVKATTPGAAGNVNAYTVDQIVTSMWTAIGLKVENRWDLRGGVDVESDAELRKRIRATFLRNVAGTEDAYMGVSQKVTANRKVNVVGPVERWEEQLEVVDLKTIDPSMSGWGMRSMIPCSRWMWPRQTYLVREPGTANERQYVEGVDYTVDPQLMEDGTVRPVVRVRDVAGGLDLDGVSGAGLDRIGESIGLPRFAGTFAVGSVAFGVDSGLPSTVTINAGQVLRAPDGTEVATKADATIWSQSLSSSAVPVMAVKAGPANLAPGTRMELQGRSGFKAEVSERIEGGEAPWDDETYRERLALFVSSKLDTHLGDFLFFRHEYTPLDSRNDPSANPPLTNKVDVFIDGEDIQPIRECTQIALRTIDDDPTSDMCAGDWWYEDGSHPVKGTKMQILGYAPVRSLPDGINVNGAFYDGFELVRRLDRTRGSVREVDALAFRPGSSVPSDGSFLEITYDYNRAVLVTDQLLDTNRQITTDVLCHEANKIGLCIPLVVQSVLGASDEAMLADVNAVLDAWADSLDFGAWVQWSDIEQAVRMSKYVDACRLATSDDRAQKRKVTLGAGKGEVVADYVGVVQPFKPDLEPEQRRDFRLRESQLAYIRSVSIVREAANTYNRLD